MPGAAVSSFRFAAETCHPPIHSTLNPTNPRTDPRFTVSGVPTLVHWPGGGAAAVKLGGELEEAKSIDEAVAVVGKFILDTKGA